MAEASTNCEPSIKLESSDGRIFEIPLSVASMSRTVKHMLDDIREASGDSGDEPDAIPLPNVTGDILDRVISYCTHHVAEVETNGVDDKLATSKRLNVETCECDEEEHREATKRESGSGVIGAWDKQFCEVDQVTLFELILAANYLDIKPLLDLTCKTVANQVRGKSPEDIRNMFGIKNDFSEEEYAQALRENAWLKEH